MGKKAAKKSVKAVRGNAQIAQKVAVPPPFTQSSDPTSADDEEEPFLSPSASDSEESDEKIGARVEEAHLDLLRERELSIKAGSNIEDSDEKISAGSDEANVDLLRERAQVMINNNSFLIIKKKYSTTATNQSLQYSFTEYAMHTT